MGGGVPDTGRVRRGIWSAARVLVAVATSGRLARGASPAQWSRAQARVEHWAAARGYRITSVRSLPGGGKFMLFRRPWQRVFEVELVDAAWHTYRAQVRACGDKGPLADDTLRAEWLGEQPAGEPDNDWTLDGPDS